LACRIFASYRATTGRRAWRAVSDRRRRPLLLPLLELVDLGLLVLDDLA
jgi:hypothetical protein